MKLKHFTALAARRLDRQGAALVTVVAIFAVVCVLAVSITSLVFLTVSQTTERNNREQAYLTAKSILIATQSHIKSISGNRSEVEKFVGQTAAGELTEMGTYTASIEWSGNDAVVITVNGYFKDENARLAAIVNGIGGDSE